MVRIMLKPFLKRFIGLFISMVFVGLLSIALLTAFASSLMNLGETYTNYLNDYDRIDCQIYTNFFEKSSVEDIESIDGVKNIDARLSIDAYLKKDDGRVITSRIFTYNNEEDTILKRYIIESKEKRTDMLNISIVAKFARTNGISAGSIIKIGYFNMFIDFYVYEIIDTPEAIYPRANNYIWSDNQDFGYLYIETEELNSGITRLAGLIQDKINADSEFKNYYEQIIAVTRLELPDFRDIEVNFVDRYANQVVVEAEEGYDSETLQNRVSNYLKMKGVNVKDSISGENLPYRQYMVSAMKQLSVASIFLPVFFYSVTMVIIGLFINQIIKAMTKEIGIMVSVGISKWSIVALFLVYSLLMSIVAGIIGVWVGYFLNHRLTAAMIQTYSIPMIPYQIKPIIVVSAILFLMIFSCLATLIACSKIFKITPKDACISNEAKRKRLPSSVEHFIDKAWMNIKLGVNSILQNPRRFFVSIFSIIASFTIILLCSFFYVSKNEMISQTVDRRLSFDCQTYYSQKVDDSLVTDLESQPFVIEVEDCGYTYLKVNKGDTNIYVECLGVNKPNSELLNIPDSTGFGTVNIKNEGIVLPVTTANQLKVGKGDTVTINGKEVIITDISFQYFHPVIYLSKTELESITPDYVSSFLINTSDSEELLDYLTTNSNQCLTVFTTSLAKDMLSIFDTVNLFIYILIGFAFLMGLIILVIMSQNALMEQKRQVSVLRLVGFKVLDISNFWTVQSFFQLLFGTIFAIPLGALSSILLFSMASSNIQTYPFLLDYRVVLIGFGFIFMVVLICHLFSMISIKRWNLADNTRCRE